MGRLLITMVCRACVVVICILSTSRSESLSCDNLLSCCFSRSRQRRAPCNGPTYTMRCLIEIIERLEKKVPGKTAKDYVRYLRKFMYEEEDYFTSYFPPRPTNMAKWDQICGQIGAGSMPDDALDKTTKSYLGNMITHGVTRSGREVGVVLTDQDGTVAAGHVVTGISCGGFNRDTELDIVETWKRVSSHLDNLFFVTIAGDMGQTSLQHYSEKRSEDEGSKKTHPLFGPSGKWDSLSYPREYILPLPESELTEAEVNGDMDGVILGTLIPMIKDKGWKLSRIFSDYYQEGGIRVGKRLFSASNRKETFGELVSDVELEAQSKAFAEAYYNKNNCKNVPLSLLLPDIHEAVQIFYKDYVSCTDIVKKKYSLQYFVELVKELEDEKKLGVIEMTRAIVGISEYFKESHLGIMLNFGWKESLLGPKYHYEDHFAWYVLRELVSHGFSPSDRRRELGVIEAGGDTVAIGHVLAGIHAGMDRNFHIAQKVTYYEADTLYGATVAGSLARAAVNREMTSKQAQTSDTMGATGTWDRSKCPIIKYKLKKNIKTAQHTTRAELLGGIDGFVLGELLPAWLHSDPGLKLSKVLELYYSTGIDSVSMSVRFDQFAKLAPNEDKMVEQTTLACKDILWEANDRLMKASFILGTATHILLKVTDMCTDIAKQEVKKLYKSVLQTSGK